MSIKKIFLSISINASIRLMLYYLKRGYINYFLKLVNYLMALPNVKKIKPTYYIMFLVIYILFKLIRSTQIILNV